jgi:hypothetical protein
MFPNLHPKCANFVCEKSFEWMAGGKLFRFRRDRSQSEEFHPSLGKFGHGHPIEHFWLCERCSHIYTLDYEPGRGVLIRLLWPALPAAENNMRLPAS